MKNHVTKSLLILLFACFLMQCKKETYKYEEGVVSNTFDAAGRVYSFTQHIYSTGNRNITVDIPADAVTEKHSLFFNSYGLENYNSLSGYYIDFYLSDINYFTCSSAGLLIPATITLPFRNTLNWAGYGYTVFHVNVLPEENLFDALNDNSKWTEVTTPYVVDNVAKTVSFQTKNLNGVYVVAKLK